MEKRRILTFLFTAEGLTALDAKGWELYHVAEDFAENHNLADQHRDRLIEMILLWYIEAGKYHLLPIDQDGKLHYAQNVVSAALLHVESTELVPSEPHTLRFEFEPTGKPDIKAGKGMPGRG